MTFLPIVERELRVALRRPGTYWVRWLAALAALGGCLFALSTSSMYLRTTQTGQQAFRWLAWLGFLYALTAGPRTAAASLSEEKREGTLGLLFLTDLKGHDVVLGKLVATSLNTFYGLLGMLPVLAIPLLLGGVTYAEFGRTALALVNALLLSLSASMFVSSLSRDDRNAMGAAVFVVLGVTGGLPLAGVVVLAATDQRELAEMISACSPGFAFLLSHGSGFMSRPHMFWISIGCGLALSAGCLALASRFAVRIWQVKAVSARRWRWRARWRDWILGPPTQRAARRRRLLEINPVLWLVSRPRFVPYYPWFFLAALTLVWWLFTRLDLEVMLSGGGLAFSYAMNATLKYWVAVVAAGSFAEDRHQGALELVFSTSLRSEEVVRGHWLGLRRLFAGPLIAAAALQLALLVSLWVLDPKMSDLGYWVAAVIGTVVLLAADCWAVAWVGMWLGVKLKKVNKAASATVSRVLVLPWLGTLLFVSLGGFRASLGGLMIIYFVTSLGMDLCLGMLAREKLLNELRAAVAERQGGTRTFLGLPLR